MEGHQNEEIESVSDKASGQEENPMRDFVIAKNYLGDMCCHKRVRSLKQLAIFLEPLQLDMLESRRASSSDAITLARDVAL